VRNMVWVWGRGNGRRHTLHLPVIIRGIKFMGIRTHEEERNAYEVLVGEPEGWRPLGRCGCKWEDNIKVVHK
jgi:hypothetical protein